MGAVIGILCYVVVFLLVLAGLRWYNAPEPEPEDPVFF